MQIENRVKADCQEYTPFVGDVSELETEKRMNSHFIFRDQTETELGTLV